MGIVPWKHGFSADLDTYRSRAKKKAEQADKMRALEERVVAVEGVLAASHQQQDARSVAHLDSSPGSQRHSSIASTEQPAGGPTEVVANEPHHHPMDDITVRTPCELLYQ